jgi:hypothetical protein
MRLCPEVLAGAETWGLPLVIMNHTLDHLACSIGVNHLYNASTLAGPTSTSVVALTTTRLIQLRLLGRTQVNGPTDLAATFALQKKYSLTTLTVQGSGAIGVRSTSTPARPPATLP